MEKMNWIDCGTCIVLIANGKQHQVASTNPNHAGILDALNNEDWEKAAQLADIATAIKTYVSPASADVEVRSGGVYYKGEKLGGAVVDRILSFMQDNKPTAPLIKFVERLMANPSFGSRQRLYEFLERNKVPITERGTFLCYKAVLEDYRSKTAGRETVEVSNDEGASWTEFVGHIPNNVGNWIKVDRSKVDDNPANHCSYGLHAGGIDYVNWFGGYNDKKVIVEVDPADVVSVPPDHDCGKLRTCFYKVVCDFAGEFKDTLVENASTPYADGGDEDYEDDDYDNDYDNGY